MSIFKNDSPAPPAPSDDGPELSPAETARLAAERTPPKPVSTAKVPGQGERPLPAMMLTHQTALEQYQEKHKVEPWKHNAAVAKRGWLPNQGVAESDYLTALEEAANEEIR
jgi:hypothetical protein